MTPQEPPLAIELARKHVQSGDFTDADYALCQLAEENERLERNLDRRDKFIVERNLWSTFCDELHKDARQALGGGEQ